MTTNKSKMDVKQAISERIALALENELMPWQKPWDTSTMDKLKPFNGSSGRHYNGVNRWVLATDRFHDPRYYTFKQANDLEYKVNKGEKGQIVVYYEIRAVQSMDEKGQLNFNEDGSPDNQKVPMIKTAVVFNADQLIGVPPLEKREVVFNNLESAESMIDAFKEKTGLGLIHSGSRAFYRMSEDKIYMPDKGSFKDQHGYYSTALHELGHSTGHPDRVGREFGKKFGDQAYAREELVAEFTSAMLCAEFGIPMDEHYKNHTSYIKNWCEIIREDKNAIFNAIRHAEKASEYSLGLYNEHINQNTPSIEKPLPMQQTM